MRFNLDKIRANVQAASTDDLLDRATLWRDGMEPAALDLIEAELRCRGVKADELEARSARLAGEVISARDGLPALCYRCQKPAIERRWVWGKLWRLVPLFPRRANVCKEHRPGGPPTSG
jgi:hypothetical protein